MAEDGDFDVEERWDSFSVYAEISQDVATSVSDAIDAYWHVHGAITEETGLDPAQAAEHKRDIGAAAQRLITELENEEESVELYGQILNDWRGEDGFINRLGETRLHRESPGWLNEFIRQIHRAAWELGYLQAGRKERKENRSDPERSGREMVEDILNNGAHSANA